MIRYCRRCLYPETKPDLSFDEEGTCSACINFENREQVDREKRRQEFLELVDRYRSKDGSNYDCVIPVSGGKDSHYQSIRMLEAGLTPLCVTATTDSPSSIPRRNSRNKSIDDGTTDSAVIDWLWPSSISSKDTSLPGK